MLLRGCILNVMCGRVEFIVILSGMTRLRELVKLYEEMENELEERICLNLLKTET